MRKAIPLAFALLALALPAGAAAQNVPPGNSAAAQYTETFPTSKGEENAQGPKTHVNPNKVIGSEKTKQLEEQGPEGAAVAEFTAETAPTTSAGGEESSGGENGGKKNGDGKANGNGNGAGTGNGGGNGSKSSGGGGEPSEAGGGAPAGSGGGPGTGTGGGSGPSGSSAVGEVASQATGVSSGELGLWLPIVLVAVLAWAAFVLWRRRDGAERAV